MYTKRCCILTILLLLIIASPLFANDRKVALLPFSINIDSDKIKEHVKKASEHIHMLLLEKVKKANEHKNGLHVEKVRKIFFKYKEKEPFSYESIESPDVTIDPTIKSGPQHELSELSKAVNLNTVIIGHFEENLLKNSILIVVRIFQSKTGEFISFTREVSLTEKELYNKMTHNIHDIVYELDTKYFNNEPNKVTIAQIKDQRQNNQIDEKEVTEQQKHKGKKIKESTERNVNDSNSTSPDVERPKSADYIYEMLLDNGFYCNVPKGAPLHEKAIEKIAKKRKSSTSQIIDQLYGKRYSSYAYSSISHKKYITLLTQTNKKELEMLLHNKAPMEEISFSKASELVKELNRNGYGGYNTWKIPTIEELFDIFQYDSRSNRFSIPHDLKLPTNNDGAISLWSSTPVREKWIKENYGKSYWILKAKLNRGSNLEFNFSSTRKRNYASILPVVVIKKQNRKQKGNNLFPGLITE